MLGLLLPWRLVVVVVVTVVVVSPVVLSIVVFSTVVLMVVVLPPVGAILEALTRSREKGESQGAVTYEGVRV